MKFPSRRIFYFCTFFVAIATPLFLHLGTLSIRLWDESRLAVNALEMLKNGNWLVTYFDGQPDLWNTKPPLMIWLQVLAMKIFGKTELAVRLPAALAALATALSMFFFAAKYLQRPLLGALAALVLVTTNGYVDYHVARTGDYDSLLIFWNTLQLYLFYLYIQSIDNKANVKYLYALGASIFLAVMTKSIIGLMFLPTMFVYVFWQRKLLYIIKNKHTYIVGILTISSILAYYLTREYYNEGYLQAVWREELYGRYAESMAGHTWDIFYYVKLIFREKYRYWLWFLPLGLYFLHKEKSPSTRQFLQLMALNAAMFLAIVSQSRTQLPWYESPIYPNLAFLVALGLEQLYYLFIKYDKFICKNDYKSIIYIVLIFIMPYFLIVKKVYVFESDWFWQQEQMRYKEMMGQLEQEKKYQVFLPAYNAHLNFYRHVFAERGYEIAHRSEANFAKNDRVLVCEQANIAILHEKYALDTLHSYKECIFVTIK